MKKSMRPPNLVEIQRAQIARHGFEAFAKRAWSIIEPAECLWNWHHSVICQALQKTVNREIKKLIINVPPGCTKTTLVTKLFPAYAWALNPCERVIRASYDQALMIDTAGASAGTKAIVASDWYRALYPHVVLHDDKKSGDGKYFTTQKGFQYCTSTDKGRLTGRHGTIKIIDDPLKPSAVSGIGLEKVNEWYGNTFSTRNASQDTVTIIIAQRVARNDLPGFLLEREPEDWVHLKIPMRYEGEPLQIGHDPRTKKGELLWPDRYPESLVQSLTKDLGGNAEAQLQQNPIPPEGIIFKREWLPFWDRATLPPVFDRIILSVDCTFKGKNTSDRVGFIVAGQKGPKMYLLHVEALRLGFLDTLKKIILLKKKFNPQAILVEDKANGSAILEVMKSKVPGVLPIDPGNVDKVSRANAVVGYVQAGDFLLGPDVVTGQNELLRELCDFPKGKHDDLVDAFTQLCKWGFGLGNKANSAKNSAKGMAEILGIH